MIEALALIGAITALRWAHAAWRYFRADRSGNSGRLRHWLSNPRI